MTGNIGILGGFGGRRRQGLARRGGGLPYDRIRQRLVRLDQVRPLGALRAQLPQRQARGSRLWPRDDELDGKIPNIKAIFWHGSDWFNQLTNINKEIQAIKKLELVVCMDSTITPSGLWADVLFPIATHFERHDVALPWYRGITTSTGPKVISRWASRPTSRCSPSWPTVSRQIDPTRRRFRPSATTRGRRADYFRTTTRPTRPTWSTGGGQGAESPGRDHVLGRFQEARRPKIHLRPAACRLRGADSGGQAFRRRPARSNLFTDPGQHQGLDQDAVRLPEIPAIPKWIEPFESLNHQRRRRYPST